MVPIASCVDLKNMAPSEKSKRKNETRQNHLCRLKLQQRIQTQSYMINPQGWLPTGREGRRPAVIGTKEISWLFYIKCYDLRLMMANIFKSWSAGTASGTASSRRQAVSPGSIALLRSTGAWLHPQTVLDRSEIWLSTVFEANMCSVWWNALTVDKINFLVAFLAFVLLAPWTHLNGVH